MWRNNLQIHWICFTHLQHDWRMTDKGYVFFLFPFYPLSSCQTSLASHFPTDWLSWLGLGNQVGSTTDHLTNYYLPSTLRDRSTMRAELTGVIANRGWGKCYKRTSSEGFLPYTRSHVKAKLVQVFSMNLQSLTSTDKKHSSNNLLPVKNLGNLLWIYSFGRFYDIFDEKHFRSKCLWPNTFEKIKVAKKARNQKRDKKLAKIFFLRRNSTNLFVWSFVGCSLERSEKKR